MPPFPWGACFPKVVFIFFFGCSWEEQHLIGPFRKEFPGLSLERPALRVHMLLATLTLLESFSELRCTRPPQGPSGYREHTLPTPPTSQDFFLEQQKASSSVKLPWTRASLPIFQTQAARQSQCWFYFTHIWGGSIFHVRVPLRPKGENLLCPIQKIGL